MGYVDVNRAELLKAYPTEEAFYAGFTVPDSLVQDLIDRAAKAGIEFKADEWERSAPLARAIMKGLICRDLYEKGSYYRAVAPLNPDYVEALRLINDRERYERLLEGKWRADR